MPFMVIYSTSDGGSCHEQADAIDEAALFVERLRNKDGHRGDPHLPDGGDQLRLPSVLQGGARAAGAADVHRPRRRPRPRSRSRPLADPVVDAEREDHVDALPGAPRSPWRACTTEAVAEPPAARRARPRGRARRRQRPSGAVRPLSARPPGGSSQRLVEQRRERQRRTGRPPRRPRRPSAASQEREEPTAARRRSHHGRRSCSTTSLTSTAPPSSCRRLEPRPSADHAVRRCYRWPPPTPGPRRTPPATGGRPRRRWIALVVALVAARVGGARRGARPGAVRDAAARVGPARSPSRCSWTARRATRRRSRSRSRPSSIGTDDAVRGAGRLARRRRRRAARGGGPRRPVRGGEPPLQRAADGHLEARRHRRGARAPRATTSTSRTTGTVVRGIAEGSPAAEVLELDDVIVAVDGEPVDEPDEVGDAPPAGRTRGHRTRSPSSDRRAATPTSTST